MYFEHISIYYNLYIIRCVTLKLFHFVHPLGCPHITKTIFEHVNDFWKSKIEFPPPKEEDQDEGFVISHVLDKNEDHFKSKTFFTPIYQSYFTAREEGKHQFPKPSNVNINMMPFIVAEDFKSSKLPKYVKPYWPMIRSCIIPELNKARWHYWPRKTDPSDIGKVRFKVLKITYVHMYIGR